MLNDLMYINQFDHDYKNYLLNDGSHIDERIKDLVDAINSIDVFCTMNSCQGALIEEERTNHCKFTYVDFYVLYHQYHIAQKLIANLVHKFGFALNCHVGYETDYYLDEEDFVEYNGLMNLRFTIEIEEVVNFMDVYKSIVSEVIEFSDKYRSIIL